MAEEEQNTTPSQNAEPPALKQKRVTKTKKKRKKASKAATEIEGTRTRAVRSFPASTFQDALVLAEAFQKYAAGQSKVRRITLFDKMEKSPDSGPSRQLITRACSH